VEAAVLVPIEEWRRLQRESRPNIKQLLLAPGSRIHYAAPNRGAWKRRSPIDFSRPDFK
jgi:hypothetical protein